MHDASGPEPAVLCEEARDWVALVSLNRPERHNAINAQVARELDSLVRELDANPRIRVVVLTGVGGKAFSTGADLGEVAEGGLAKMFTKRGGFGGFVAARRKKVWIAAVEGHALAGGFELGLACDMIVASETASFGLPEVKRGLIAAAGGAFRVVRALPRSVAIELVATGDPVSAERALSLGLLNRLVPAGRSVESALDLAERIAANAPMAIWESMTLARQALDLTDGELFQLSEMALARVMASEDFAEGPRAFVEKRKPRWTHA